MLEALPLPRTEGAFDKYLVVNVHNHVEAGGVEAQEGFGQDISAQRLGQVLTIVHNERLESGLDDKTISRSAIDKVEDARFIRYSIVERLIPYFWASSPTVSPATFTLFRRLFACAVRVAQIQLSGV